MANLLQPLQTQLPAAAFAQSAGALSAFEQLTGMREARQQRAQQQQQQAMVQQLTGRALTGDGQARLQLQLLDPQAALGLQQAEIGLQQAQQQTTMGQLGIESGQRQAKLGDLQVEGAERQDRLRQNRATRQLFAVAESNIGDPVVWGRVKTAAEAQGMVPQGVLPDEPPTPEQMQEFKRDLDLSEAMLNIQDPVKREKLTGELAAAAEAYGRDSEQFRSVAAEIVGSKTDLRRAQAEKARMPPAPRAPLIQFGGVERGVRSNLQSENVKDELLLNSIKTLRELDPVIDDIATLQGGVRTSVAKVLDRVGLVEPGSESARRLASARQFKARIGRIFQPIKVALTGAAAPKAEMDDLKDILINADLGPVEIRAAMDELQRMAEDAIAIRQKVLTSGLSPEKDEKLFGAMVDSEWDLRRGGRDYRSEILGAGLAQQRQTGQLAAPAPGMPTQGALPSQRAAPPPPPAAPPLPQQGQPPHMLARPPEQAAAPPPSPLQQQAVAQAPVQQAPVQQAPVQQAPVQTTIQQEGQRAVSDIDKFRADLRRRQQQPQQQQPQRQAAALTPIGQRRGAGVGQRQQIGRLSLIKSLPPPVSQPLDFGGAPSRQQAEQLQNVFLELSAQLGEPDALQSMVEAGYVTQSWADALRAHTGGQ
jgi:hypothetical protein